MILPSLFLTTLNSSEGKLLGGSESAEILEHVDGVCTSVRWHHHNKRNTSFLLLLNMRCAAEEMTIRLYCSL